MTECAECSGTRETLMYSGPAGPAGRSGRLPHILTSLLSRLSHRLQGNSLRKRKEKKTVHTFSRQGLTIAHYMRVRETVARYNGYRFRGKTVYMLILVGLKWCAPPFGDAGPFLALVLFVGGGVFFVGASRPGGPSRSRNGPQWLRVGGGRVL